MRPVLQLILDVLPYAAGVFASPLPVILGIVLLFTPEPRHTSMVYVITWVAGVTLATVVFALLAGALQEQAAGLSWLTWVRVAAGLALIAMAIKTWMGRGAEPPAWLAGLLEAGPRQAFRYGILMSAANPKELLMALAAGIVIGTSGVGLGTAAVALVVFVFLGALSVIAPLAVFLLGGDTSLRKLASARVWLEANSAAVAAVVLGLIGVWLLVGGILKL